MRRLRSPKWAAVAAFLVAMGVQIGLYLWWFSRQYCGVPCPRQDELVVDLSIYGTVWIILASIFAGAVYGISEAWLGSERPPPPADPPADHSVH